MLRQSSLVYPQQRLFANQDVPLLRVLRVLMEHCDDLGWRDSNAARGVSELKTEKTQRDPWPRELLEVYSDTCPLGSARHCGC